MSNIGSYSAYPSVWIAFLHKYLFVSTFWNVVRLGKMYFGSSNFIKFLNPLSFTMLYLLILSLDEGALNDRINLMYCRKFYTPFRKIDIWQTFFFAPLKIFQYIWSGFLVFSTTGGLKAKFQINIFQNRQTQEQRTKQQAKKEQTAKQQTKKKRGLKRNTVLKLWNNNCCAATGTNLLCAGTWPLCRKEPP